MSYEYHGNISVSDVPDGEDAIKRAVDEVLGEEYENDVEEADKIIGAIWFSDNEMVYDGSGDYDGLGSIGGFFNCVIDKIKELYPGCSMDADCLRSNLSNGMTDIIKVQLRNRHVKEIDCEWSEDSIWCPECDDVLVALESVEFDRAYDCGECGRHVTVEEMNELLFDYVEEYDI